MDWASICIWHSMLREIIASLNNSLGCKGLPSYVKLSCTFSSSDFKCCQKERGPQNHASDFAELLSRAVLALARPYYCLTSGHLFINMIQKYL